MQSGSGGIVRGSRQANARENCVKLFLSGTASRSSVHHTVAVGHNPTDVRVCPTAYAVRRSGTTTLLCFGSASGPSP